MITIPPAFTFNSGGVTAFPVWRDPTNPPEGLQYVPILIDWSKVNNLTAVQVNIYGSTQNPMSRIMGLVVDNSESGSDVEIVFPDVSTTYPVPAGESAAFPVNTQSRTFFVVAPNVLPTDLTNLQVLNFPPAPYTVPRSTFQNSVIVSAIPIDNTGPGTTILANTISGTLDALYINCAVGGSTNNFAVGAIVVTDGTGLNNLGMGMIAGVSGAWLSFNAVSINPANWRFKNGLSIGFGVVVGAMPSSGTGKMEVCILYRTP